MGVQSNRVWDNSQGDFAEKTETVIIFDWDDTLFPCSNLNYHVSLKPFLHDHNIPDHVRIGVSRGLANCTEALEHLLRLATSCGKVLLVTLAKETWVTRSCEMFLPRIGQLLKELNVEIVYAMQGIQVDRDQLEYLTITERCAFWSRIKGDAIAKKISGFYSQYDGQSWKNIISIGDSEYERLGTQRATEEYIRNRGMPYRNGEIVGHFPKVRTKTLKLMDQPTIKELMTQLAILQQWLPVIVGLDDDLDIQISGLADSAPMHMFDETLDQKISREMNQLCVSA